MKLRLNFRIKKGNITFFLMYARTQTLDGVTSLVNYDRHIVMWDLENCTLKEAEETLRYVQQKYGLSHIYICSDIEGSYRAWCFTIVDLRTLLRIILETDYIDYSFLYYTVKRCKATLRTSCKKNRTPQKLISVLPSHYAKIPDKFEHVIYDTGTQKRGHSILLGDKN